MTTQPTTATTMVHHHGAWSARAGIGGWASGLGVEEAGARGKREFSSSLGRKAGEGECLDKPGTLGEGSGCQQKKFQGFQQPCEATIVGQPRGEEVPA